MASTTRPPPLPVNLPDGKVDQNIRDKWQLERQQVDVTRPYTTYTPVITGTSAGFVYGTGAYQLGRYKREGPRVNVEILIFFGNPGYNSGGNTTWSISLPILPRLADLPTAWNNKFLGTCYFNSGLLQYIFPCVAGRVGPGGAVLRNFVMPVVGLGPGISVTGTQPAQAQGALMMINLSYECTP